LFLARVTLPQGQRIVCLANQPSPSAVIDQQVVNGSLSDPRLCRDGFQGLLPHRFSRARKEIQMPVNPDKSKFKAWLDTQPPDHHTLHVTGSVKVLTTGWKAKLVEAHPQGINKEILILKVEETAPTGEQGQIVEHIEVHFEKKHSHPYKQVEIKGDGPSFTIDVKKTH
jgi:hypothetical protein